MAFLNHLCLGAKPQAVHWLLHVRKTSKAEPQLARIDQALGIDASPGCVKKLVV